MDQETLDHEELCRAPTLKLQGWIDHESKKTPTKDDDVVHSNVTKNKKPLVYAKANEAAGLIFVKNKEIKVRQTAKSAHITVHRMGPCTLGATILYTTKDDTAKHGVDFEKCLGVVRFRPKERMKLIEIFPEKLDLDQVEFDEEKEEEAQGLYDQLKQALSRNYFSMLADESKSLFQDVKQYFGYGNPVLYWRRSGVSFNVQLFEPTNGARLAEIQPPIFEPQPIDIGSRITIPISIVAPHTVIGDVESTAEDILQETDSIIQKILRYVRPNRFAQEHLAIFTIAILFINCIVFSYMVGKVGLKVFSEKKSFDVETLQYMGGRHSNVVEHSKLAYTLITSMGLHTSINHLLNNMFLQTWLSYILEKKYGFWRVFALYFFSGISGGLWSTLCESNDVTIVGASGCCYGLVGAGVADLVQNRETMRYPIMKFIVLFLLIASLASEPEIDDGVSHFSHVGGLLGGISLGIIILPNLVTEEWEKKFLLPGSILLAFVNFVIVPILCALKEDKEKSNREE